MSNLTATVVAAPNQIYWRGIRLARVEPRTGESDRFESDQDGGPPLTVWIAREGAGRRWCASLGIGRLGKSYDAENALEEARELAIGFLLRQVECLECLGKGND